MNKNNKLNWLVKNLLSGTIFGMGLFIAILGVTAFQDLTTDPSTAGNQSLNSPILSKASGTFERDTMSLQALSEKIDSMTAGMVNYKDCEVKFLRNDSNNGTTTLSCSAGYTIVDSNCAMRGNSWATYGHCYMTSNDTMELWSYRWSSNNVRNASDWLGAAPTGSIKCCKYLVP